MKFLSVLAACFILCSCNSCSSHKPYPKDNADEVKWEQQYRDGDISWSEYQAKLKGEKKQ